ncbi:MAG: ribosome maturation factor RimP [Bacilli bacterium]|nr:ribosome maturation factor RimP [Bacilli bacterium]
MELEQLIRSKLQEIGYELISINSSVEKGEHLLSIVVDRVAPIDMDAIVEVSHVLNAYLDELNPFENSYTLDISSLGAEKPLNKDKLGDYVNRYVHVHLVNPIAGENIYEGTLVGQDEEKITLEYKVKTRTKVVDITKSNISKIRLAIKF